jgi:hypothetical protein
MIAAQGGRDSTAPGRRGGPPGVELEEAGAMARTTKQNADTKRVHRPAVAAALGLAAALAAARPEGREPGERIASGRKQLLVDDAVVAERHGVTRVLERARKQNGGRPVRFWRRDAAGRRIPLQAWIYASPYWDAERGVFRLWSRVYPDGREARYGYSESRDGLEFDFKAELRGIRSNGDYNSVVTIDAHETDPAHRYKMGYDCAQRPDPNGACLAHSADGIEWTPYNQGRPVTGRAADFTNALTWDPEVGAYRLLTRTDFGTSGGLGEIRGVRSMTNPDVKANPTDWKTVRNWLLDREGPEEHRRRQIYTMTDWVHADVHFGLVALYEWPYDASEGKATDHVKRHERDVLGCYLATSRDGVAWNLEWVYAGTPLVERGGDGAWDKDMILPANWIATRGDTHWIYYGGANERHGVARVFAPERDRAIGVATLPLDRFVALEAGEAPGRVVTHPFRLAADAVEVNVAAGRGEIRVAILDDDGRPVAGYSGADAPAARGIDDLRWRPRWRGNPGLGALRGRTVRLEFQLRRARLYCFQVR